MELQKVKHKLNLEQWRQLIYECRGSGQTVRAWCKDHHICPQTYYRWQRTLWDAEVQNLPERTQHASVVVQDETVSFAEYRVPAPVQRTSMPTVTIRLNNIILEIQNGVCAQTMETVLKAVKDLC